MRITDAVAEYHLDCLARNLSPATCSWYDQKLAVFVAYLRAELGLEVVEGLQLAHIHRFTQFLTTSRSLSTYTVRGYVEVVKNFVSWAAKEDVLTDKLHRRITMPKVEQHITRTLSRSQYDALSRAAICEFTRALQLRDAALLALLLDTGVRASELLTLAPDDLHLGDDSYLLVRGKGRKQREVGPLGIETQQRVRRHLRGQAGDLLFSGRQGNALTVSGLDQLLYRLRDWAGADLFTGVRVSAHTFRHTFAVNYLKNGGDLYTLSLLLGHTSVSVTQHYLRDFQQRDARRGKSVLDGF